MKVNKYIGSKEDSKKISLINDKVFIEKDNKI